MKTPVVEADKIKLKDIPYSWMVRLDIIKMIILLADSLLFSSVAIDSMQSQPKS